MGPLADIPVDDDDDTAEVPPNIVMREAWRRLESVLDGFYATGINFLHLFLL
jgi:hypothetical protein